MESTHHSLGRHRRLFQPTEHTRAQYLLILVLMLMRCLPKSGFDRRHIAEAALPLRHVMGD